MDMYEKFEKLLEKQNISAYRVAKETGLYPTLFSEWKHGKSIPKIDKIKKVADYFDVDINYFLEED